METYWQSYLLYYKYPCPWEIPGTRWKSRLLNSYNFAISLIGPVFFISYYLPTRSQRMLLFSQLLMIYSFRKLSVRSPYHLILLFFQFLISSLLLILPFCETPCIRNRRIKKLIVFKGVQHSICVYLICNIAFGRAMYTNRLLQTWVLHVVFKKFIACVLPTSVGFPSCKISDVFK